MSDPNVQWLVFSQESRPALAEDLKELQECYEKRLWHQLSVTLQRVIEKPSFRESSQWILELHESFISRVLYRLSPWSLAKIAVAVSKAHDDAKSAIAFLESAIASLKETQYQWTLQPEIFVKLQIAQIKLQEDDDTGADNLLDELKEKIDGLFEPDPQISSAYHFNRSMLYSKAKNFAEFYKSSLQYLCYVDLESLSPETQQSLAVDVSFAALLGEGIYSFGELILHPIIKVLEGGSYAWLLEMLSAFNNGDLHKYDELCTKHASTLNSLPEMVEHERDLREKIVILALVELIFNLPSDKRTIPLTQIAERTKLAIDGVEFLLMKTLSLKLIKGYIDEVDQVAEITWVQPRVLTKPQVTALNDKLGEWVSKVESATKTLEADHIAITV